MNMAEFRGFYELNSCTSCGGTGYRAYASTATWRGGAGGMAITNDICDRCWGSGDSTNTWCDLWKISNQLAEKDAQISKDGRALKEAHAELSRLYARIEQLDRELFSVQNKVPLDCVKFNGGKPIYYKETEHENR